MTDHDNRPRDFDFWIGNWDVTWADAGRGRNRITSRCGDRVLLEEFEDLGAGLVGMSVTTYDAQFGAWRQAWVDSNGRFLLFAGGLDGDRMVLVHHSFGQDGHHVMHRMVWEHIERDRLDWRWERTDDEGATWRPLWLIHYERVKPGRG